MSEELARLIEKVAQMAVDECVSLNELQMAILDSYVEADHADEELIDD